MRPKYSKAVDAALCHFYATLATAAAARALARIKHHDDDAGAEVWARIAEKWLHRAGAKATGWSFEQPKP